MQHGGPIGCLFDLGEPLAQILVAGVVENDFDMAVDDGQQVVEVVGDASGELSHGLHLLCLYELLFELLLTGDILRQDVQKRDFAGMMADGAAADQDLDYGAIATQPGALDAVYRAAGEQRGAHRHRNRRKRSRAYRESAAPPRMWNRSRAFPASRGSPEGAGRRRCSGRLRRAPFDQRAVAVFGETQGAFGHHTLGEIESHTDDADDGAVGSESRSDVGLEVASVDGGIEGTGMAFEGAKVSVAGRLNDFGGGEEVLDGLAGEIGNGDASGFESGAGERGEPAVRIGGPEQGRHSLEKGEERREGRAASRKLFFRAELSRKSCIGLIVCLGKVRGKRAGAREAGCHPAADAVCPTRCGEVELLFHGEL